jgi:hypothetical protein
MNSCEGGILSHADNGRAKFFDKTSFCGQLVFTHKCPRYTNRIVCEDFCSQEGIIFGEAAIVEYQQEFNASF